jgi:hypothetical protein
MVSTRARHDFVNVTRFVLTKMNKGENILPRLPAVVRSLVFLGVWFVLYRPDLASLPVGVGAAVAATWTSLRLLPPGYLPPTAGVSVCSGIALCVAVRCSRNRRRAARVGAPTAAAARLPDLSHSHAAVSGTEYVPFNGKPAARNAADRPG